MVLPAEKVDAVRYVPVLRFFSVKPLPEAAAFHIWLLLAVGAASVTVPSLLAVSRLPEDTLVMV